MAAVPPARSPIITLRFGGGPPQPESAITDLTPDQHFEVAERQRVNDIQARDAQRREQQKAEEAKSGGGFGFKLGSMIGSAGAAIGSAASGAQASAEASVRNAHVNKNKERFAKHFPQLLAAGEQLITDYDCKVLHQGQKVTGHAILSTNYLCFESGTLIEIIPLREISCLRHSVALETIDNGPPYIMITPAPNVISDTLQVFTVKQQLFQFIEFGSLLVTAGNFYGSSTVKGSAFERFFNFLDHAWRVATPVPVPGVQYAA